MRIALVAPPWYAVPPAGYGGIEWVVALLADGLTDRGHDVTLFAPSGSTTRARLVSPLGESPSPDAIGHPWFVAISESQRSLGPPDLRWARVVYNGIAMDRYQYREDKDDFLFFLGRADEE